MLILFYCIHHTPSLLADDLSLIHDLRSYEFESDGLVSLSQSMGYLQQSVGFWENIGASGMVLD